MAVITVRLLVGSPIVEKSMFYHVDTDDSIDDVQRRIDMLYNLIISKTDTPPVIHHESNHPLGIVGLRLTEVGPVYAQYLWERMIVATDGVEEVA